nr:hypothetical protein [Malacoplasma sp.]
LIGKALKKITNKNIFSSAILNIERGGTKITQSPAMIVRIFFVILCVQIFFAFILSSLFYSLPFYEQKNMLLSDSKNFADVSNMYSLSVNSSKLYFTYQNYANSLWAGIFMTASSLNNAGIDLFGTNSLEMFRNDNGIIILSFILIMFTIGGIGFPVIYDINIMLSWYWNYYILDKFLKKKTLSYLEKPKFSSFSKICLSTSLIMIAVVLSLVFMCEYIAPNLSSDSSNNHVSIISYPSVLYDASGNAYYPFGKNVETNKNFSLFFTSMSTRASAGFTTLNMKNLNESTIWILIFSIFIGASPSSTGGGIRVTTVAILSRSIMGLLRGVNKVSLFKRNIPTKNIIYAFVVLIVSIGLILFVSLIMFWTTDGKLNVGTKLSNDGISWLGGNSYSYSYFIFESVSAFGTSGLSSGIIYVDNFGWWNIVLIIILMFIGQMGMYTSLTTFARKIPKKKESYYQEEYVRIA